MAGNLAAVRQRFKDLEDGSGHFDPHIALEDARDPASPLHEHLEWDDTIAGEAYRLSQIESLARQVKYVFLHHHQEVRTVQYVRNPALPQREPGYVNIQRITRAGHRRSVIQAEVDRVLALYERGRKIALSFDMEDEYRALVLSGMDGP